LGLAQRLGVYFPAKQIAPFVYYVTLVQDVPH
jgi:hypothetical protein